MSNKIAVVTGGTRGIGMAIALELAKNNYHIYICARNKKELDSAKKEILKFGNVTDFELDISNESSIKRFVSKIDREIHVLVNNAGICGIEELEDDHGIWDNIINTNLNGVYYLTKGLCKWIAENGSINPLIAIWLPNIIFGMITIYLYRVIPK